MDYEDILNYIEDIVEEIDFEEISFTSSWVFRIV